MDQISPVGGSVSFRRLLYFLFGVAILIFASFVVLSPILTPLLLACCISFLLAPVVDRLEVGYKRSTAVWLLLFLFYSVTFVMTLTIVPVIFSEMMYLVGKLPNLISILENQWIPFILERGRDLGFWTEDLNLEYLIRKLSESPQILQSAPQAFQALLSQVSVIFEFSITMILTPVLTFVFLVHLPLIKENAAHFIPPDLAPLVKLLTQRMTRTLREVIYAQLLVAALLGGLYYVGWTLLHVKDAGMLALISGMCRMIPYLDILVAIVFGLLSMASDFRDFYQVIGFLGVIFIVQTIDGMLITPRVVGGKAGLHPVVVILSLMVFAQNGGVVGALIAIPAVAVLKSLGMFLKPFYLKSSFFSSKNPAGKSESISEPKAPME